MASPRFAPAGLLVEYRGVRVMFDGGPGAVPEGALDAWLVTDIRAELIARIRELARERGVEPAVSGFSRGALTITPHHVIHTSHPTYGYLIETPARRAVWAPEFFRFPSWVKGADVMFADAAGWNRPIRFAGGVGGHAAALDVAERARRASVRRLVLAHIGRPTIRALDRGDRLPFGEVGRERARY
jgi:hypothetical protein